MTNERDFGALRVVAVRTAHDGELQAESLQHRLKSRTPSKVQGDLEEHISPRSSSTSTSQKARVGALTKR
eukprot:CAMPEP_0204198196 /NCGR_PEP_ID=MMETSP0361-20130328/65112_1 /ASSEMBLY_ACC=CAM_ASM_000343 /TAXON_ID=268821 /ORGANISM="Scrippsiella Hangoei, Strain SHTV-5" /LENGTH=69 /DNA_ID=CAMNT_0051160259 /DNA_START=191 /DNA_END=397 /DNA_ORIENTATION=-